jgi:hypothetical protein
VTFLVVIVACLLSLSARGWVPGGSLYGRGGLSKTEKFKGFSLVVVLGFNLYLTAEALNIQE